MLVAWPQCLQGDGLDGFEPVVVLPHSDDLSSTTSIDDLEEGKRAQICVWQLPMGALVV